jgi:hypothetical protein
MAIQPQTVHTGKDGKPIRVQTVKAKGFPRHVTDKRKKGNVGTTDDGRIKSF